VSVPNFLRHHRPAKDDVVYFDDVMANSNKAKVWIAELRADDPTIRYDLFGKALHYEIQRNRRRSVIDQLRGAYNRARGHVEAELLEEHMS